MGITYSSSEVCEASGASYRQLDHWVRTGLFGERPVWQQGSGSSRRFSERERDIARALKMLSDLLTNGGQRESRERVANHVAEHGLSGTVELAPGVLFVMGDGATTGKARDRSAPSPVGKQVEPRFKGKK